MQQRFFYVLVASIFLSQCNTSSINPDSTESFSEEGDDNFIERLSLSLAPGLSIDDALSVVSENGENPDLAVTVEWPERISHMAVQAGTLEEQRRELIEKEKEDLEELIEYFDPEDPEEALVHDELSTIRGELQETNEMPIRSIEVNIDDVRSDILKDERIQDVVLLKIPLTTNDSHLDRIDEARQPIAKTIQASEQPSLKIDFSNDTAYDPKRGQSRICGNDVVLHGLRNCHSMKTIQRFKMPDADAMEKYYSNNDVGIEIKTLISIDEEGIRASDYFVCGDDWSTDLMGPKRTGDNADVIGQSENFYLDTPFLDQFTNPGHVVECAVGVLQANQLQANKLYYAMRSFDTFDSSKSPKIQIQWAPTHTCNKANARELLSNANAYAFLLPTLGLVGGEIAYEIIVNEAVDYFHDRCEDGEKNMCKCTGPDSKYYISTEEATLDPIKEMPIQPLVQYDYNDEPGKKVCWDNDFYEGNRCPAGPPSPFAFSSSSYSSLDLTTQDAMDYIDPPSHPQGYIDPTMEYVHVVINGVDRRIDEITYDGTLWSSLDLTSLAPVPYAAPGTSPMGFSDEEETTGIRYVVFNGSNARIQMFENDGLGWKSTDLTSQAAVDYADIHSEPYGYVHPYTGNLHVVFNGSNRRIYEFTYDGVQWTSLDLTSQAPVDYASAGTSPMGFGDPDSAQRFVVFNSQGRRIHYLQYTGSSWQSLDLTAQAPVDNADLHASPFGAMDPWTHYLHVVFNGQDGRIYEFTYDGTRWTSTDLSAQAAVPYSYTGTSPMIAINPVTKNRSVVFTGNNRRIQQFTHTGTGWTSIDLTSQAAVEYAAPGTSPSLFVHPETGEHFVVFSGENARIQMIRDGRR